MKVEQLSQALDDETRKRIYAMFANRASTKTISDKTGVDEKRIKDLRRAWKDRQKKDESSCARAQTIAREPAPKCAPVCVRENEDIMDSDVQKKTALEGLFSMIPQLTDGMDRIRNSDMPFRDMAWAETAYAKVLAGVYKQIGAWGGLDIQDPDPIVESPIVEWEKKTTEKAESDE